MKVKILIANWHQSSDRKESGEDYDKYEVGKRGVDEIIEIWDEQEKYHYLIKMENGKAIRHFNPNSVEYFNQ